MRTLRNTLRNTGYRGELYAWPKVALSISILLLSVAEPAVAKWQYRVTPLFRLNSLYYMSDIPGTNQFRSSIRGELNGVYRWESKVKVVFQPIVEYDPTATSSASTVPGAVDNSETLYYDLREAYVQFRANPFTFELGNQIFSWGVTDGFSPVDVINARRYVSPLQSDKIGAPAATVKWNAGDYDLELVYIPIQRESILPGEDSRWLPREIYINRSFDGALLNLPSNIRYFYREKEELDSALNSNFAARFRGQIDDLGFSLMYFQGFGSSPALNLQLSGVLTSLGSETRPAEIAVNPDVGLVPVYFKKRVVGGTLVYTLGSFILRLESAFTTEISENATKALPGDYDEHVLSVERDIAIGGDYVTAVLQGTYTNFETDAENGTTSLSRIFEGAVIAGLRYAPNEKASFIGSYIYDTKRKDTVLGLNADYKLLDTLTASLTMSLLTSGNQFTPLGTYDKNDLLSLTVRYDF